MNNDSYPQNKRLESKNATDAGYHVFSEIATRYSIKRFPFFSGIILGYSGPFHESFMLDVPITVLILPSEFKVVAIQKGILKLKDLMFRDYAEFVYYPKIGNIIIEQVQRAIIDFILFSNQPGRIRDGDTQHLLRSPEELAKSCFFSGSTYIKSPELKAIDVYSLDFSVRFHNNLKN